MYYFSRQKDFLPLNSLSTFIENYLMIYYLGFISGKNEWHFRGFKDEPEYRLSSVQFSCSVVSYSLLPHELQQVRPPVHQQLPESTQTHAHWVGDAIQPSHPLSSPSPPTLNLSGSFQMSQLFASGGQSIGVSASTSVLPMSTQDWSPLGWTGWI